MKHTLASDLFAHALCDEYGRRWLAVCGGPSRRWLAVVARRRRWLAVGVRLRGLTKNTSSDETCVYGVGEITELIKRIAYIMVGAIILTKNRNAYQSPVRAHSCSNHKLRLEFRQQLLGAVSLRDSASLIGRNKRQQECNRHKHQAQLRQRIGRRIHADFRKSKVM